MGESIKREVDEIILRTICQHGIKALPMDLMFLEKYELTKYYFMSIEFHIKGIPDAVLNKTIIETVKPLTHRNEICDLVDLYNRRGKKGIMPLLRNNELYFKKFYKIIRNEETIRY